MLGRSLIGRSLARVHHAIRPSRLLLPTLEVREGRLWRLRRASESCSTRCSGGSVRKDHGLKEHFCHHTFIVKWGSARPERIRQGPDKIWPYRRLDVVPGRQRI